MIRSLRLVFGALKLVCILAILYIFFVINIIGGGGPILLGIAIFFVYKFVASATKKG